MAARQSLVGLVVVFHVIGAKVLAGVVDIDVIVGDEEIALSTLRTLGGKLGDAALGRGALHLLRIYGRAIENKQGDSEQRCQQKRLKGGRIARMRVAIHAEDAANRISPIA
jgi:hypothetical protein